MIMNIAEWLKRHKTTGCGQRLFSIFIPALLWGDFMEAQGADTRRVYRPTAAQLRLEQQNRERAARIQAIRSRQAAAAPVRKNAPAAVKSAVPVRTVQAGSPVNRSVRIRYTWFKGRRFVLLQDVARYYGMNILYFRNGLLLRSPHNSISLIYNKRLAVINRVSSYLTHPPVLRGALVYLDENDFLLAIDPVLRNATLWKHPLKTVLIDPGHGGKDQGAPGVSGLLEKNITLAIGRKLAIRLRKHGCRVFMTRVNDRNLTLQQRVAMCENLKPDLFISIHCNAVSNRRTTGIETFAATPQGAASTSDSKPVMQAAAGNSFNRNNYRLAYEIQKNLLAFTGGIDRGVRHARFYVIRNAVCPAVLIETGFLTHPKEGVLLNNAAYQEKIVNGIFCGVLNYAKVSAPAVKAPSPRQKYLPDPPNKNTRQINRRTASAGSRTSPEVKKSATVVNRSQAYASNQKTPVIRKSTKIVKRPAVQ